MDFEKKPDQKKPKDELYCVLSIVLTIAVVGSALYLLLLACGCN